MQMTSQMDGVEPSVMFDELNQTQMTFPPNANKADKNHMKLQQLGHSPHKTTHGSFIDDKKQGKEVVTGIEFYKDFIS